MPEERSKSTRALPDVQEAAKWAGNVASTAVEYITPRTDQVSLTSLRKAADCSNLNWEVSKPF